MRLLSIVQIKCNQDHVDKQIHLAVKMEVLTAESVLPEMITNSNSLNPSQYQKQCGTLSAGHDPLTLAFCVNETVALPIEK